MKSGSGMIRVCLAVIFVLFFLTVAMARMEFTTEGNFVKGQSASRELLFPDSYYPALTVAITSDTYWANWRVFLIVKYNDNTINEVQLKDISGIVGPYRYEINTQTDSRLKSAKVPVKYMLRIECLKPGSKGLGKPATRANATIKVYEHLAETPR